MGPVADSNSRGEPGGFTPGLRGFALLLLALSLVFYWAVWFAQETFIFRDYGFFGYPLAQHLQNSLLKGELPLWNPLSYGGHPFLAQWNTLCLYPPMLGAALLPLQWSLGVFCLVHQLLGGLGAFALARHWTRDPLAAAFAGLAFAFSGLLQNSLIWPNNIAALGWMPWVILWLEQGLSRGGRLWLCAVLGGTLQMLTGAPEVILITWIFATGVALVMWRNGAASPRVLALRFIGLVGFITLLASAQLLPFLDLLRVSYRDSGVASDDYAMPGSGWAHFLVPLFHAHKSFYGVYAQTGQYWTNSYYAGIPVLCLALWALVRIRNATVVMLGVLAVGGCLMAMGSAGHLQPILVKLIPVLGFVRFPIKFVLAATFALPLLAAFGLAQVRRDAAAGNKAAPRTLWFLGAVTALAIGGVLMYAKGNPLHNDDVPGTLRNGMERAGWLVAALGLLAVLLRGNRFARLAALGLLLVAVIDLERHEPRHPTVDPRVFTTPVPQPKPLPRHGVSRAMITPSANYDLAHSSLGRVVDDYLSRRVTLFPNCNLIEGVPVVDGFFALSLKEEYQVRALMYARTNQVAPRFMEFMGVSQYTSPTNLFDWQATTNFLPFATVGQQPVYLEAQLAIDVMLGTNWNPRAQLLLSPDQRNAITVTNSARGTVTVQSAQAHRLLLSAETAGPSWVVISQSYDPNWRATVDGAPAKVFRGNHAYTALQVPGGKHVVVLEYKDRAFQAGSGLSLAALGFWFFCWFKRPQKSTA